MTGPSGWHSCFVSGTSSVEMSARRPDILVEVFRVFLHASRQIKG
jgi:hypothetical protein